MKKPVQPWEFRAKPAWQRLLIMIGGVVVNFLLALFIYTMILFHWGEQYIPAKDMTMGYQFNEQAEKLGFRDGAVHGSFHSLGHRFCSSFLSGV